MPVFVDTSQVQAVTLPSPDGGQVEAIVVPVVIPVAEVAAELAEYDPESGTHPYAAQAKPIARAYLDALLEFSKRST